MERLRPIRTLAAFSLQSFLESFYKHFRLIVEGNWADFKNGPTTMF